ncbi:MAG TPA: PsbP-related protein [Ktedonobacteraceae bacterium]|nr:PsbP-related protein [Ktedonobacteraceae bacterium]
MLSSVRMTQRLSLTALTICSFLLSIVLVACGGSSDSGSTATSSSPTKAPATQAPAATSQPTTSSSTNLQTFSGDSYSIGYPKDWKITPGDNKLTITDPSGADVFMILVTPNSSGASTDSLTDAAVQEIKKNLTSIQDNAIDQHVSLAGETWNQVSFDGDSQGTRLTYRALITNHQANGVTNVYMLSYAAPRDKVDQLDNDVFVPMLNSFTFK